ncbi:uncharacterized protein LOC142364872 [Opisthocomus hoazin]|uniref:uncharacterized protein LOC142364872 n=1 Tax=Opisthocomus hoazin TaxID=30419 RepID=UPI003F52D733
MGPGRGRVPRPPRGSSTPHGRPTARGRLSRGARGDPAPPSPGSGTLDGRGPARERGRGSGVRGLRPRRGWGAPGVLCPRGDGLGGSPGVPAPTSRGGDGVSPRSGGGGPGGTERPRPRQPRPLRRRAGPFSPPSTLFSPPHPGSGTPETRGAGGGGGHDDTPRDPPWVVGQGGLHPAHDPHARPLCVDPTQRPPQIAPPPIPHPCTDPLHKPPHASDPPPIHGPPPPPCKDPFMDPPHPAHSPARGTARLRSLSPRPRFHRAAEAPLSARRTETSPENAGRAQRFGFLPAHAVPARRYRPHRNKKPRGGTCVWSPRLRAPWFRGRTWARPVCRGWRTSPKPTQLPPMGATGRAAPDSAGAAGPQHRAPLVWVRGGAGGAGSAVGSGGNFLAGKVVGSRPAPASPSRGRAELRAVTGDLGCRLTVKGAGSFSSLRTNLNSPPSSLRGPQQQDRHPGSTVSVASRRGGVSRGVPAARLLREGSPRPRPLPRAASPAAVTAPRAAPPEKPKQERSRRGGGERGAHLGAGWILSRGDGPRRS